MRLKLILLARDSEMAAIIYNSISAEYKIEAVILEKAVSKTELFSRRRKKLGIVKATGQVLFMATIFPFLKRKSVKRKKQIFEQYSLDNTPIPEEKIQRIKSVNSDQCRKMLTSLNPDLVIVNGTRIISLKTLNSISQPFINIHVGITPRYRGVHGGYWAMVSGQKEFFGTTIHQVDAGIDTGKIIEQVFAEPEKKDNFYTYPFLQNAVALPKLKEVIRNFDVDKKLQFKDPVVSDSRLWYHPTLFQWLKNLNRSWIFIFMGFPCL